MMDSIPSIIYDNKGNIIRIVKTSLIFFPNRKENGYVFHVESEERITSVSEFDLEKREGQYFLVKDIFIRGREI